MANRQKQKKWKLFGSWYSSGSARTAPAKKRRRWPAVLLSLMAGCIALYCICVYSNIPFIKKWRTIYIETALSTMNHQWLATKLLPKDVVTDVQQKMQEAIEENIGVNTTWEDLTPSGEDSESSSDDQGYTSFESPEQAAFYELFWEIDRETLEDYLDEYPYLLDNGWENLYINEAGLDDKGTTIQTTMGEQVLAIDARNQVLLVRIDQNSARGVLAIAKDPSRLSIEAAANIGESGQYAGYIAENHDGILAVTANGFVDVDGVGNGGQIIGYSMCNGVEYGMHSQIGYKRVEIRDNDLMYIVDAQDPVRSDVTDAAEFIPALIVDGEIVVNASHGYTALNPRVCIGQSDRYEMLLLVIEGRLIGYSLGADAMECADILERHNCMQAMNLDGGTSAIMYYDGEYVTRCSNTALPYGRMLPNAVVYKRAE